MNLWKYIWSRLLTQHFNIALTTISLLSQQGFKTECDYIDSLWPIILVFYYFIKIYFANKAFLLFAALVNDSRNLWPSFRFLDFPQSIKKSIQSISYNQSVRREGCNQTEIDYPFQFYCTTKHLIHTELRCIWNRWIEAELATIQCFWIDVRSVGTSHRYPRSFRQTSLKNAH